MSAGARLALLGGPAVRRAAWPSWPRIGPQGEAALLAAAASGRWACSGHVTEREPFDRVFADAFADYLGVRHCLATDHGSSALVIAFEGLGIGYGDDVIVPGLTWTACLSTVARVNARPVLIDIDPATLCIDPDAVEAAITDRTAAILAVHLYSCVADLDRLTEIARRRGLFLIEDAAQVHGAAWRGRKAGTVGDVGVFSMQQGKLLTSGEGGAIVTDDPAVARVFEELRNDGRRYASEPGLPGRMDLDETAGVFGANRAPSEFQLAVLLDGLSRLDEECETRASNVAYLDGILRENPAYRPLRPYAGMTARSFYHFPIPLDRTMFGGADISVIADAVSAELGTWVKPPYQPLDRHPLATAPRTRRHDLPGARGVAVPYPLLACADAASSVLLIHHANLLADRTAMDDIAAALEKVRNLSGSLPDAVGG